MGSDDYTVVDVSSIDDALITDVAFSEVEHPLKPEVCAYLKSSLIPRLKELVCRRATYFSGSMAKSFRPIGPKMWKSLET